MDRSRFTRKRKDLKKICRNIFSIALYTSIGVLLVIVIINVFIVGSTHEQIVAPETLFVEKYNSSGVALVLGASVRGKRTPSPVYGNRLDTAIALYEAGVVDRILVSGANNSLNYDEVRPGRNYLVDNNISTDSIFLDFAGLDTFDSVYRAKNIYQIDRVYIVTQQYHLHRALYIANALGIDAIGVRADRSSVRKLGRPIIRERFARIKAFGEVHLGSRARFGGETIPINGDSNGTT